MTTAELRLTTKEVADSILRTRGTRYPMWTVRRVIDALDDQGVIVVQRCGLYRTIASADVARIAEELAARAANRELAHA